MKKGSVDMGVVIVLVVMMVLGFTFLVISSDNNQTASFDTPTTTEVVLPGASNFAVDNAGVLSPAELTDLNTRLGAIDKNKSQIAVLLVKTTSPLSMEEYSIKLAEKWKVGMAGLDDGAIIIIATDDRKVRLEVGKGLEGDIPDAEAGRIIRDDMGASLHDNKWHDAIVAGINSISAKLK